MRLGYIKHDINAGDDDKLIQLQTDFGFSGTGFYWELLELVYRNEGKLARKSSVSVGERGGIRKKTAEEMVDEMVSLGLFREDGGDLISDRAMEDIRACMERQETYRNNSNARWNKNKGMDNATATDKDMQQRCNCMKGDDATALQPPRAQSSDSDSCSRSVSGSTSERDCSDSLHSSSLPSDDVRETASPDGTTLSPQPDSGLGNQQDPSEPKSPVFLTFPRIGKPSTYDITEADVTAWETLFPAVDIRQALKAMLAWLRANPKNGKSNIPRFVVSWLQREQDKAGPQRSGAQPYRKVASDRTPEYDFGEQHAFDNTKEVSR
jgi:hypothetical protein